MKSHRIICGMLSALTVMLCVSGCGTAEQSGSTAETEQPADSTPFAEYLSNTWISTGNNTVVWEDDVSCGFRVYLPVEAAGEFEYCFYFSNNVDSTWAKGEHSHAGMQGSAYTIDYAEIGIASEAGGAVREIKPVTFGGSGTRAVSPGETFWSDPLTYNVPEGQYLVWTWYVHGEMIPATVMSDLAPTYVSGDGKKFVYTNEIPLPQLIGCKRDVQKKIALIGDSITQGCGTPQYGNAFWGANIAKALGTKASLWNLGLGYARASDCALNGDWLARAKHADLVLVAFGTNDMVSGQYGVGKPNAASAIENWLRQITVSLQEAGCEVILLNAPPFDFDEVREGIRTELNAALPAAAESLGVPVFDWASLLIDPNAPGKALYGGHPDETGCKIISDTFLSQFADRLPA